MLGGGRLLARGWMGRVISKDGIHDRVGGELRRPTYLVNSYSGCAGIVGGVGRPGRGTLVMNVANMVAIVKLRIMLAKA